VTKFAELTVYCLLYLTALHLCENAWIARIQLGLIFLPENNTRIKNQSTSFACQWCQWPLWCNTRRGLCSVHQHFNLHH